jgi:hypothetical protein
MALTYLQHDAKSDKNDLPIYGPVDTDGDGSSSAFVWTGVRPAM